MKVPLTWKPDSLFAKTARDKKLIFGYTYDGALIAVVDGREPKGFFGITAHLELRTGKNELSSEHLASIKAAKEWCERRLHKKLTEWINGGPS